MIGAFNNHFKQICINLNPIKKVFVLGLSGGMDSMALLYLLKDFLVKIRWTNVQENTFYFIEVGKTYTYTQK